MARIVIVVAALLLVGSTLLSVNLWRAARTLSAETSLASPSGRPQEAASMDESSRPAVAAGEEAATAPPSLESPGGTVATIDRPLDDFDAVASLGWPEAPDDRWSLQDLLDDPDPDVRAEAALLLQALNDEALDLEP